MNTHSQADAETKHLADRLHSIAIHLLRKVRVADSVSGLSARRLSALSVVVFAEPITISELAEAEQVAVPTVSRLVKDLVAEGLVTRQADSKDGRIQRIIATPAGRNRLQAGRDRRIQVLVDALSDLAAADRALLLQATDLLRPIVLPLDHPLLNE